MIEVKAGQSLRSAVLNAPASETVISVEAGATFNETVELPAKDRSSPLVIQSSRVSELPADKRVASADSAKLFKIIPSVNVDPQRAIITKPGAHHYTFLGMEVAHDPSKDWHTLISLGDSAQHTIEEIPHSLVFDRCYIHGHKDRASVRAIALNSAKTDILNSYISDIHSNDVDSQAICGWAGPGPFRIENCYLEAAGENVMFGGADPLIAGLIPSDITIRRCYFFKPLTWKVDDLSFAGRKWITKNLLETKNARRVIVDGCVFENCWADAQVGFAILLKSNNQESTAPWSVTEDLAFTNNSILNSEHGVNILGTEVPPKISDVTKRLKLLNNFWQVRKIWLQITNGGEDIELSHNTFFSEFGSTGIFGDTGQPTVKGFVLNNNLGTRSGYGLKGDGMAEGTPTLNKWTPGWTMEGNVLATQNAQDPISSHPYPAGNSFPAGLSEVGFVDLTGGNYRLRTDSVYKGKATDGKDPGVDWDALEKAQQPTIETPLPTEVAIRGKILRKDGTPVKGVRVMINPGVKTQLFTKDDGSFAFVGLKPGRYVVIAGASNAWWVYQPGYRAFDAKQDVVNADFVAVDSNDSSLFT